MPTVQWVPEVKYLSGLEQRSVSSHFTKRSRRDLAQQGSFPHPLPSKVPKGVCLSCGMYHAD